MINGITFTGAGSTIMTGLERTAKKVADKTDEFIGVGHVFEKAETAPVKKSIDSIYTSPFAGIKDEAMTVKKAIVDGDSFSYAISHGTPEILAKEASAGFHAIV